MTPPRVVRSIYELLAGVLQRDRYLTELGAALVTFGIGVVASLTQDGLATRASYARFRDMPCPEGWVIAFCLPGIWSAVKLWREGERYEGRVSLLVMLSFVVLALFSMLINLENWGFWALFALQLGILKGYALILEWGYLRWSVSILGSYFWISLTLSIGTSIEGPQALSIVTYAGFAGFNLLSVWRARGHRNG
jgi:xanthine/uracil permease